MHVTLKLRPELGYLRRRVCFGVIRDCISAAKERLAVHIVEFSVQADHIHLLCEAEDAEALSRGMQGLTIRIAKGLNKALQRKGPVFADRFHAEYLTTPRRVRFCLAYVLNNHRRHGEAESDLRPDEADPCSSAAWFGGWRSKPFIRKKRFRDFWSSRDRPTAESRCWLLRGISSTSR